MPTIKIDLHDENFCLGCLLDSTRVKCRSGIERQFAKIVEEEEYLGNDSFYSSMMFGSSKTQSQRVDYLRPLECKLRDIVNIEKQLACLIKDETLTSRVEQKLSAKTLTSDVKEKDNG